MAWGLFPAEAFPHPLQFLFHLSRQFCNFRQSKHCSRIHERNNNATIPLFPYHYVARQKQADIR